MGAGVVVVPGFKKRPILVRAQDGRVDVAFAADRFRVAKLFRDRRDGDHGVLFGLALRCACAAFAECHGRQDGAGPGAEILGGETVAGQRMQIFVDIVRGDGVAGAVVIHKLEQFLARQMLAGADDFGQTAVVQIDGVLDPALAAEFEMNFVAVHSNMTVAQRGQAEGLVFPGILGIADADVRGLQELHDDGEDFFAGQAGEA